MELMGVKRLPKCLPIISATIVNKYVQYVHNHVYFNETLNKVQFFFCFEDYKIFHLLFGSFNTESGFISYGYIISERRFRIILAHRRGSFTSNQKQKVLRQQEGFQSNEKEGFP